MEKDFIERFEMEVRKTIRDYSLAKKSDKIVVACSGGKDSTTTLFLLKKFGFNVEGLIIDLHIGKWSDENLANIKRFCKDHDIRLHVFNLREHMGCSICFIRSGIQSKKKLGNCTICGVIKRWILNREARKLSANKIATGHNLDDEAESIIMNIVTGNPNMGRGMFPSTGLSNSRFVERIKPLYFHTNKEIRKYSEIMGFPVLYDQCPCSVGSFRHEVRKNIAMLEKEYPDIKMNIVKSSLRVSKCQRRKGSKKDIMHCKICREPSRNDICKRCKLMKIIK